MVVPGFRGVSMFIMLTLICFIGQGVVLGPSGSVGSLVDSQRKLLHNP